jgi:hypothetical protein
MSTITSGYRTSNANFLSQDITNSDYYIFVSTTVFTSTVNSDFSSNDFLEKTLFGKKINPSDTFFMIENRRWLSGTVYDQYDDMDDMTSKAFYIVVYPSDNSTGDYRVFKCLFNNYGAQSVNAPNYETDVDDQIYRLGDGYVWKYMYAITTDQFKKYSALNYAPIIGNASANTVINKSIDHIEISNPDTNKGYELKSGLVEEVLTNDVVIFAPDNSLSEITDYYSGQILYVTDPNNESRLYTIDNYSYNISNLRGTLTLLDKDSFIQPNFSFKIFPRIEITGDGTGAIAVPSINQFGVIEKVTMHNKGSGYTNAAARVVNPLFGFDPVNTSTVDVEAILRPILSPEGGHATNFKYELGSKQVLVYLTLTDTDNLSIPSSNKYGKVGIVKNPTFITNTAPEIFDNRLELQLNSSLLTTDEIVTQSLGATVTFRGQVHEASGNTAYICNYHGPYENYDNDGYFDLPLDPTKLIVSSQNQFISINNVVRPPYVQKTGDVYYMTSFATITRTPTSNEEYKIVLEF